MCLFLPGKGESYLFLFLFCDIVNWPWVFMKGSSNYFLVLIVRTHGLQEQRSLVIIPVHHTEFCVAVNHIRPTEKTPDVWQSHRVQQLERRGASKHSGAQSQTGCIVQSLNAAVGHRPGVFGCQEPGTGRWWGWGTGIPWMMPLRICRNCGWRCLRSTGEGSDLQETVWRVKWQWRFNEHYFISI